MSVTFTINGAPFGKQRPRFNRKTGRTYTPAKTVSFENTVRAVAVKHFPEPIEGPVSVTIYATFEPFKSWSKKKTASLICCSHTQKPDSDNVAKAILDGLNRIAFVDDGQVADLRVKKLWGPTARTDVVVESIS